MGNQGGISSSDLNGQNPISQFHAFAFQTGVWRVRHRKLVDRLIGSNHWEEFGGRCRAWETLAGGGNVEDHEIEDPRAHYRAGAYRMLNPATGCWSIWWFDPRFAELAPPVVGRFSGNRGEFFGDDTHEGSDVRVRFIWTIHDADRLEWEQSFSADAGQSWERNWVMLFSRA